MGGLPFKNLLDHIPEALIVVNAQDQVVYYNTKAKSFEKLARTAFQVGISYMELISDERKEIVRHALESSRQTNSVQVLESEIRDPEGRSLFFESIYEPFSNADGAVEFICIFFRDRTVEKIFEKRTIRLLKDYADLIENANAVIFSIDSKSYITEWNAECERITGFSKDDVLARKIDQFIAEPRRREFGEFLENVLQGAPLVSFEVTLKKSNGDTTIILLNATPRTSNASRVVGVLFVGHDITELSDYRQSLEVRVRDGTEKLKAALEKEKELVDIKNRFVSMASHEFRIPLTTIITSVSFLKKNNSSLADEDLDKLAVIEKQIGHMRAMIDDVLTIGKSDAARLIVHYHETDLAGFLKGIIGEVITSYPSHRVNATFAADPLPIHTDEKLLRNIFLNLLSNAAKFSPGQPVVDLTVTMDETVVTVMVRDYGIGIPDTDLQRVFTPFNRGTNAGEIRGTGLGLSIVKRACDALEAKLNVASKPGEGTTFTVALPLIKETLVLHDKKNKDTAGR